MLEQKKVIEYALNYINLLDPDLLPSNFYTQMQQIQQKIQSSNQSIQVTQILDEILSILAFYGNIYIPKNQIPSAISEMIGAYNDTIKKSLQEINFPKVKKDAKAIENYEARLLSAEDSIQKQITDFQTQIQTWFNEIQKFRNNFFEKQDNKEISLKAEIEQINNNINARYKEIDNMAIQFAQKLIELDNFHIEVFGNLEGDKRVGGLKQEVKDRLNEIDKYDETQKQQIQKWKNEIRDLLDIATNASLASSYEKSNKSYKCAIMGWNATFIISILGIFGVAIWGFVEIADKISDPLVIFGAIFARLPFYIPLAWLAIFATNRRNENKRLQEEYKHKETLAKAYSGYKEQIEKLEDSKAQELAEKLMDKLVEMTNENPNRALDKVKKEKMPTFEMIEKLSDLISKVKN
ncbi:hypothetical protein [Helicobacter japonicus]|uniref:Uncharacterized protein n=4 Tax=Helicobacter japonicus TaxID=425400 RepID=A0A4V6I405_9HELI|nr:hypothetical protein [Helicobacter japonicus]TLE02033.1 hypothetical protein LS65_004220 [Helicobacter japonicus]